MGGDAGSSEPIVNFNRARSSVAAERNTAPIVEVVTRLLGADASGTVRQAAPDIMTYQADSAQLRHLSLSR